MKKVFKHELDSFTLRMVRFTQQTGKAPIRTADFPYPYISKKLWEELGQPHVIKVTVEPVLPREGDSD